MSGTPAPNSMMEYWGQMEFVRRGLLNETFSKFRNEYFHLERNGEVVVPAKGYMTRQEMAGMFKKGFKYELTDQSRNLLLSRIKPFWHVAKKKYCLDLPPQLDEVRTVEMGPIQTKKYKEMKDYLLTIIDGEAIAAPMILTKIMKLRQITSGFIYDEEGNPIAIKDATKMKELVATLEEIGDNQVIIWAQFKWEISSILRTLNDNFPKEHFGCLYSDTDDKEEVINWFKDGHIKYLIANPHSAGHGLTFTNCAYQIFYSLDYSWEAYEQARARTHRAGQTMRCTYIHLICDDSIDKKLLKVLRQKGNAQNLVTEFKRG